MDRLVIDPFSRPRPRRALVAMRVEIHLVHIQRSVMRVLWYKIICLFLCVMVEVVLLSGTHKVESFEKSSIETSYLVAYEDINRTVLKKYPYQYLQNITCAPPSQASSSKPMRLFRIPSRDK